jgi:hypothetical protein
MNKTTRFTIRYVYAGICQYADFIYSDDKLIHHTFSPQYCKGDNVPSLEGLNVLADIISVIEKFTGRKADIYMVDSILTDYYYNQPVREAVYRAESKYTEFVSSLVHDFFDSVLLPIMVDNGWKISYSWIGKPILIELRDGEWDNVKNSDPKVVNFEYLCHKFSYGVLGDGESLDLRTEQSRNLIIDGFSKLSSYLDDDKLKDKGVLITLD